MQKAALVIGLVFLVVGVAGFIPVSPPATTGCRSPHTTPRRCCSAYSRCRYCITSSTCCSAAAGLVAARTLAAARNYLIIGGAIYLVLFLYGLMVPQEADANFVPVSPADDILHLVLGVGMVGLGIVLSRRAGTAHRTTQEA